MANSCYYLMKIKGNKNDVDTFIRAMNYEGEYKNNGVGRVYECDQFDEGGTDSNYYAICDGTCAWSVITAMRNKEHENNLESISEKLNLGIEVYSEELGFGFQEHFCVINGIVKCDECNDYTEIDVDDIESMDDLFEDKILIENGVTKDNYQNYIEDGYLRFGGFKTWDYQYI